MFQKVHVILQARIGSKRLYGKSVIPVFSDPLVVLCNKRLKNSNLNVTTIIPEGKEDDYLAYILKKNKLKFFRGSKLNVLDRFKKYTKHLKNKDIIVRVTADNPFVDGIFLKKLIVIFKKKKLQYLSASDNIKSLPYGVQAELFYVNCLRETVTKKKYTLEHVTPFIKKKYLNKKIKIFLKDYSHETKKRLSIDSFKDLERVRNIFNMFPGSPYSDLSKILKSLKFFKKGKKKKKDKISKIILGTVQIGKKYFSKKIKITQARANQILTSALDKKINYLDTAHEYGKAEEYIGNFKRKNKINFNISTKLKNLKINKKTTNQDIISKVNFSIFESMNKLNSHCFENFLIHNSKNLFKSKLLYNHLTRFLSCGIFKSLGVSIYSPEELKQLKNYKKISCVQLPFNLLDYKWVDILSKKNKRYKFFIRSIFLRGNLKKNKIIFNKNIYNYKKTNRALQTICQELNKKNLFELTISYLKSFTGINYFVVGAHNAGNINNLINLFKTKPLKSNEKQKLIKLVKSNFNVSHADLRNWN